MTNTINDILSLHNQIMKDHEEKKCIDKEKKWNNLMDELSNNMSDEIKKDLKYQCHEEDEASNYNFFLLSVIPILDEYEASRKRVQNISFFKPKQNKNDESANSNKTKTLVDKYMDQVFYYFGDKYGNSNKFSLNEPTLDTDAKRKQNDSKNEGRKGTTISCNLCNSQNCIINDTYYVCKDCGNNLVTTNDQIISYKDISRISISYKYSYDRRSHFRESIRRFQGKQSTNIPSSVFHAIYSELKNYQLLPEDYDIKQNDTTVLENINREHIAIILKELNYSKYYEDLTYIYHKITRKPIPNISHLEDVLMSDFDQLLELYDNLYSKFERKNFINNSYVLYQLLRKNNLSCPKSYFSILKTNDRKQWHDEICERLFHDLNWNFNPVF